MTLIWAMLQIALVSNEGLLRDRIHKIQRIKNGAEKFCRDSRRVVQADMVDPHFREDYESILETNFSLGVAGFFFFLDVFYFDLNVIVNFLSGGHIWFVSILGTCFLTSLLAGFWAGYYCRFCSACHQTAKTGVRTRDFQGLLDLDGAFEAPLSLAITTYGLPFSAHTAAQCCLGLGSILLGVYCLGKFLRDEFLYDALHAKSEEEVSKPTARALERNVVPLDSARSHDGLLPMKLSATA